MLFEVLVNKTSNKDRLCTITHEGQVLTFVLNYFIKNVTVKPVFGEDEMPVINEDRFKYVNQYLTRMPADKQDAYFALFKKARDILTNAEDHDELIIKLRAVVARIMDFRAFSSVHLWLRTSTDLQNPQSLKEAFVEDAAGRNKQNKTYIRKEYEELVTLTFLIRLLLPVFGEFLARIDAYTKATSKEAIAFSLLSSSDIMDSPAMTRLSNFVENTIPKDTNKSPALIEGISSNDYTDWLLAVVIMRRLTIGGLQDTGDGTTLVSFIYSYIVYRATNTSVFGGFIKDKQHPNAAASDVNELSSWEEFRIKERYSAGDIAVVQQQLMDASELYDLLCVGLDEEGNRKFAPTEPNIEFMDLRSEEIGKAQTAMLMYIMSPLVSHRLLDDVERPEIFECMIAGAAYLKRLGHLELAILLTTVKRTSKVMTGSASTTKHHITEEQIAQLNAIYPYVRKTQSRQVTVDTKTPYETAFAAFEHEFKLSEWKITLPHADLVQFTGGLKITRAYACPTNIRPLMAEFLIAMDAAAKRIHHHRTLFLEELLKS